MRATLLIRKKNGDESNFTDVSEVRLAASLLIARFTDGSEYGINLSELDEYAYTPGVIHER